MEPSDQRNGANSSRMTPKVSNFCPVEPVSSAGPIRINTPPKPMINPKMDSQVGLFPRERRDSNSTSQNGDVEIINAAIPDGTVFSAKPTNPLPPSSNNVPTIAVDFQFPAVGFSSPAMLRQA